jgi:hypothetical protein
MKKKTNKLPEMHDCGGTTILPEEDILCGGMFLNVLDEKESSEKE